MKNKKLWLILLMLIILTPFGLILPKLFGAGGAWGEWGAQEIQKIIGYAPLGLKRLNELWRAPFSGYGVRGTGELSGYLISALIGSVLVVVIGFLVGRMVARRDKKR